MRCNICYLDIINELSEIKCPRCLNSFHKDHLAAWLLNEKSCPVCREELSQGFRDELKPRDERDRKRLLRISQNLQSLGTTLDRWESRNKKKLDKMYGREAQSTKTLWLKIISPFLALIVLGFAVIGILSN